MHAVLPGTIRNLTAKVLPSVAELLMESVVMVSIPSWFVVLVMPTVEL